MSEYFSLSECDVIGFDLDHTLCRYNLKETSRVSRTGIMHGTTDLKRIIGLALREHLLNGYDKSEMHDLFCLLCITGPEATQC